MASLLNDEKLERLLTRLHADSKGQEGDIGAYFQRRIAAGDLSREGFDQDGHRFMADKLAALEPDKAASAP